MLDLLTFCQPAQVFDIIVARIVINVVGGVLGSRCWSVKRTTNQVVDLVMGSLDLDLYIPI